nr:ribonuclease H-like domain-containing protein [Tanacetum cinerariifolium]
MIAEAIVLLNLFQAVVLALRHYRMGKLQNDDKGFINIGCSRNMTGNIAYLSDFKKFDGGYVTFGGGAHGGRISGKSTLKTDSLEFENVYFATLDESLLWHRRLGHVNFKNINMLVQDNLVRGMPIKRFENDQTCVACLKGKQHIASWNGPKYMFNIDSLTQSMNYVPIAPGTISDESVGTQGDLNVDGTHNENDDKDKSEDDNSPKEVNAAGQHVNTASLEVNTGASDTLKAIHVEFFNDRDATEVDLGNIPDSYRVPTTSHTRIHKDYPIKNVIGETEPTSIVKALSDSSWVEAMQEELLQFKL